MQIYASIAYNSIGESMRKVEYHWNIVILSAICL